MTKYNIFCYSEKYNDDNSFQQKSYRAFNTYVGEKRFWEIEEEVTSILQGVEAESLTEFWKKVPLEQWRKLIAIPEAKDFKKGFEYISGQTLSFLDESEDDATDEAIELLKSKGYKIVKG